MVGMQPAATSEQRQSAASARHPAADPASSAPHAAAGKVAPPSGPATGSDPRLPTTTPPDGMKTIARPAPGYLAANPSSMPRAQPSLPSKLARPGGAGAAGASPAFATKPAPKVGPSPLSSGSQLGAPSTRSAAAPKSSSPVLAAQPAKLPPLRAPTPTPFASNAGADAGEGSEDIEIELDDSGGGSPDNGAIEIGGDGLADAEAALEAMQSFRLAEAALQRNDVAGAQALAQKAVDGDPSQADYVTLLAWIRSLGGHPAAIDAAIATMSGVLEGDPSSERALLYRGKLLARTHRFQEALADFNELLAGNPQHREAANELRGLKSKMT